MSTQLSRRIAGTRIEPGGSATNGFERPSDPSELHEGRGMKSLTCRELGGACDQQISAANWDDLVRAMSKHVVENHPDVAKKMEQMHNEDPRRWGREMKPKWDAAPETGK